MGWEPEVARILGQAAPLHDIGKLGLSDALLLKPGLHTVAERLEMRLHTQIGERILGHSTSPVLRVAATVARSHHERWDGGGYPDGTTGGQIPPAALIVAVADVFDALTHRRPYKTAMPVAEAVDVITIGRGHHFDPDVVDAFVPLDHSELMAGDPASLRTASSIAPTRTP